MMMMMMMLLLLHLQSERFLDLKSSSRAQQNSTFNSKSEGKRF